MYFPNFLFDMEDNQVSTDSSVASHFREDYMKNPQHKEELYEMFMTFLHITDHFYKM